MILASTITIQDQETKGRSFQCMLLARFLHVSCKQRSFHITSSTSAGLKAFSSEMACHGMEICRLACKVMGYSLANGIPHMYMTVISSETGRTVKYGSCIHSEYHSFSCQKM